MQKNIFLYKNILLVYREDQFKKQTQFSDFFCSSYFSFSNFLCTEIYNFYIVVDDYDDLEMI